MLAQWESANWHKGKRDRREVRKTDRIKEKIESNREKVKEKEKIEINNTVGETKK